MWFDEDHSVRDRLDAWLALASVGKRPSTRLYYRELVDIFDRHWPDLTMAATSVKRDDVMKFVLLVGHYSAPRFNAIVGMLRSLFGDAAGMLKRRPVTPKHVDLPGQAEFATMLDELDQAHHGHAALCVRFLALTGLRINEARQVKWSHVRENGFLIPPSITKNEKPRLIPFMGDIQSVLARLRSVSTGERVLPQAECKKALASACQRAGIARLTHHDMRRLFATRCIESGVDVPTVAKWMGHSDGGALLGRTYFHLLDDHSRAMAARVRIAA